MTEMDERDRHTIYRCGAASSENAVSMKVVQVNYAVDRRLATPDALLDRYFTLTAWSDAIRAAGAEVRVVQRFARDDRRLRCGVEYVFRSTDGRLADAVV